jgi:hypothetical protein
MVDRGDLSVRMMFTSSMRVASQGCYCTHAGRAENVTARMDIGAAGWVYATRVIASVAQEHSANARHREM